MPLPESFDTELIAKAYPDALALVCCGNKSGGVALLPHRADHRGLPVRIQTVQCETASFPAGTFFGGHWAVWPTSSADYFVSCACGCTDNMYTVYDFEDHCGECHLYHAAWPIVNKNAQAGHLQQVDCEQPHCYRTKSKQEMARKHTSS